MLLLYVQVTSARRFGWANLTACGDAPPCGTVMASIDGQAAYSNGAADQCSGNSCDGSGSTGYYYQCVELAQRYFNVEHGIQSMWKISYASQMCSNYPSGVSTTGSPNHGDLIVFSWAPYGHVAVIDSVVGDTVNVVEQNSSPTGTNSYAVSDAACFLTAGTPPSGSCPAMDGYYCGNDGLSLDPDTLYQCQGGGVVGSQVCNGACEAFPSGTNDQVCGTEHL